MNNNDLERFRMLNEKLKEQKESCAFGKAIMQTEIKQEDSFNIVVFMGAYKVSKINNIEVTSLTYEDDLKASYYQYIDIETSQTYKVPREELEEFNKTHVVIKRPVEAHNFQLYLKNYNDVKDEFYSGIIDKEPEAVILSLKNSETKE